ncbi:cobalt-precorrin-5B (C(1))-methyltransferase CbiD [Myxosarcina sp. GI1]|uniref:cobalt-precorrin-5B (C(1))-methyltransferase CbiD n=1 Tax=Myxosarcina sp. GI1 TaxID=1541065 RepID=UPI0005620132|nr:cobalt-precorrin-5B (C(1))-methyltransferase CbiD [Myxosarcina sp. GI1]
MQGYTLPVFACASAIAALRHLHQEPELHSVKVDLIKPAQIVTIDIEQVAKLNNSSAIAITRSDPGDHLDLTRNTPVWALVTSAEAVKEQKIEIRGGEGVGLQLDRQERAAIYSYARELITANLQPLLHPQESITVTIILPEGRRLAKRTSNEAFGVVEGLSLLGTTGIVQPLVAASQLEAYQTKLAAKAKLFDSLVFCIGENGFDLAQQMGIEPERLVKTANWLGSMLVAAALCEVKSIVLFGYHGKLIKLAGGIFHTHNHLADGRLEIFTTHCALLGMSTESLRQIYTCETTEAALCMLRDLDARENSDWVELLYSAIASRIDSRAENYIAKYSEQKVRVGSVLFDRQRKIIEQSPNATILLSNL